jgi:GNAT superfamily N-acetyltransferase
MAKGPFDIIQATVADAAEILALQKLAFRSDAERHGDFSLPPLLDELVAFRERFADHLFLKAVEEGRILGSVRAAERDGTCFIGRLVVQPTRQGQGLGTALMRAVEARFPGASRLEIFTGHKSASVIRLYERLGYREFRRAPASDRVTLVFMEKTAAKASV